MPNDHLDMPGGAGSASPLPPHYADLMRAVDQQLTDAHADVQQNISEHLLPVQSDVMQSHSDVDMILNATVGQVDNDLQTHELATGHAMDKAASAALDEIHVGESEIAQNGVHVPWDVGQQRIDLDDPTGENIIARLMGQSPDEQLQTATAQQTCWLGYDMPVPCDTPGASPIRPDPPGQKPSPPQPLPVSPLPIDTFPPLAPPTPPPPPPCECVSPPPPPPPCGCAPPPPVCEPAPVPPVSPPNSPPAPPPAPDEPPGVCEPGGEFWVMDDTEEGGHCEVPSPDEPVPEEPPMPPPMAPPPPPDTVPSGSVARVPGASFSQGAVCATIEDTATAYRNQFTNAGPNSDTSNSTISSGIRYMLANGNAFIDAVVQGSNKDERRQMLHTQYTLAGDWLGGISQAESVFAALDPRMVPNMDAAWGMAVTLGAAHKSEGSSGMPLDYLTTGIQYVYKATNPQYILDQPELDKLYLTGRILKAEWRCYTLCHGNIPELRQPLIDASLPVPTPGEVAVLENRGTVDPALTDGYWNNNSLIREADRMPFRELTKFVPGPGDLVRFMVRDSFDANVVAAGQLDKDFELKFYGAGGKAAPGRAAQWARSQGMTEDQFRYFWYSHWEYPSNTALYEMLHRLRPDRPVVKQWDDAKAAGGEAQALAQFGNRPIVMTMQNIKDIVEINDMAPGMVDPLLSVSYHPINRTDGIAAYLSGAFSEDDLYHCFRDNGYDDPTAKTMVKIQVVASARRNNNLTGVWSIKETIKAYKDGVIDGLRADLFLQPLMPNPVERAKALQLADMQVVADNNRAWIGQIKREYIFGATNDEQCVKRLTDFGVNAQRAKDLNDTWRAARVGKFREPSAKQVLGWLTYGIISAPDCFSRLDQLGFQKSDIDRMITQAIIGWGERVEKKIEKSQKRVDEINKSMKDVRKQTDEELLAQRAALEVRIAALNATLARVQKEELDRGLPYE